MQPSARFIYHGLVLAWYVFLCYAVSNLSSKLEKPHAGSHHVNLFYGNPWKFLTFLNLVLQAIFYAVSFMIDAFILMKKRRITKIMIPFRDLIFGSLAFPTSTFVFASFWGIYFYDRELIYPTYVESFIPKWMNHGMHTFIFPLVLLEIFVTPHHYPSMGKSLVILGAAALGYQVWILYIYAKTGKWVYPVFEILSPLNMILFGGIAAIILFFCYMLGRFLNRMIWGDTAVMLDVYKKKSK